VGALREVLSSQIKGNNITTAIAPKSPYNPKIETKRWAEEGLGWRGDGMEPELKGLSIQTELSRRSRKINH